MKCNNDCYWKYNGMCCPEIKEVEKLRPNDLDCPELLRSDFEESRNKLTQELIKRVSNDFGFVDMIKIRKFLIKLNLTYLCMYSIIIYIN